MNLRRKSESLDTQSKKISVSWENVAYDEAIKRHFEKILQDRHDQLRGAARFLDMAQGQSCIRLPEFVEIEHERVRADKDSVPLFRKVKITPDVNRISLDIFSNTTLSLADSMVLASAIGMRADALVSNDDDFRRAFSENAGLEAYRIIGKPLLLLDHREPAKFREGEPRTLHSMILQSLRRYYHTHPRLGRPLWAARREGKYNWYLAYHHPLPVGDMEPSLVPGRDSVSIVDERSWTVCKIRSVYFFDEDLPEGITKESTERSRKYIEKMKRNGATRRRLENMKRSFRLPGEGKPGYIRIAVEMDDFPPSWEDWEMSDGDRANPKKVAPKNALGFVETSG